MKLRPVVCFTLLFLLFLTSASCYARTFYIKWDSTGPFTGESWDTALRKPTEVFGAAVEGDEILVAAGEYVMGVTVKSGVALRGGYSGNGLERDPRRFPTTLTVNDTSSRVVTTPTGCTSSTVIDGFVIRGYQTSGGVAAVGSPTISNNFIYGNVTGGIVCNGGSATIIGNVIIGNERTADEVDNSGGGIFCTATASPLIANNVIAGNAGGGITCPGPNCMIINNTIVDNQGNGIALLSSTSQAINNIIASSTAAGIYCSGTTPTLRFNCVYGNATNYQGITDPTGTNGNISVDPLLANSLNGNVHLRLDSPCIGAGDSAVVQADWVDMDGQARIQPVGGTVDIGADESDGTDPGTALRIVRVSPNGNDANDGSTWVQAKRSIQAAIDGQTEGCEIWVAAGDYGKICPRAYASVYGGFDGTESARTQRDIGANISLIAANTGQTAVAINGGRDRVVVDGLTIHGGVSCVHGNAQITSNTIVGGIYCGGSCCTIANNVITAGTVFNTQAGSNMACRPLIVNNTITSGGIVSYADAPIIANNIVAFCRKGITTSDSYPVLSHNCVYGNNWNYWGPSPEPTGTNGNISVDPRITSLQYRDARLQPDSPCINAGDNSYVQPGWKDRDGLDRIYPTGGTVDIGAHESDGRTWTPPSPAVVRVSPDGNDANDGSSWALAKRTIQAAADEASRRVGEVWVKSGTYVGNLNMRPFAYILGGFDGTETQRSERDWRANRAILDGRTLRIWLTADGAGYHVSSLDGVTLFGGSRASIQYAGVTIARCNIRSFSIHCTESDSELVNNFLVFSVLNMSNSSGLIANNTISSGSTRSITTDRSTTTIANNIITSDVGGYGIYDTSSYTSDPAPVLHHNCVYGQFVSPRLGTGPGHITTDPKLALTAYGNIHIQPDSPCVNAGDDSLIESGALDIDCDQRIVGTHSDIGADESDGTIWSTVPRVIRVATDGNDANDGSEWNCAMRTIPAAVGTPVLDGGVDIWVKAGTYYGTVATQPFAYLYGGFAGTETSRDQRDWVSNVTVLDGQQSATVVDMSYASSFIRVDGFTITHGGGQDGGGIYCRSSGTIANNVITGNTVSGYGGGIYSYGGAPMITGNTISSNTASRGAGIYIDSGLASIDGNTFTGNSATGGAAGAGIHVYGGSDSLIRNNVLINNTGGSTSAGVYTQSSVKIVNNTILGSRFGIYCYSNYSNLRNNIIAYNATGIYKSGSTPVLTNNDVFGNTTNYSGCTAGAGDISLDPLFVNRTANDLHLLPGSPCIDAGIATNAPTKDRDLFIRPQDGDGNGSALYDIGAYEYPMNVPNAKYNRPDGTAVAFGGISVTACFPSAGCIYVEKLDKSLAFRVSTSGTFAEGDVVNISGTLQTDPATGERYVSSTSPYPSANGLKSFVRSVLLPNRSVGGASIGLQGGITDSVYLNNLGLLVTTWGVISRDGGDIFVNDGSGSPIKLVLPSGVTVNSGSTFAVVTGISSSEAVGSTSVPVLKVRKQADIIQN